MKLCCKQLVTVVSHSSRPHVMARYYSYKWAEVLSADCFGAFEDVGLDDEAAVRATGRRFRDTVLAFGGGRAPEKVFNDFRGRGDPLVGDELFARLILCFFCRSHASGTASPQRTDFCLNQSPAGAPTLRIFRLFSVKPRRLRRCVVAALPGVAKSAEIPQPCLLIVCLFRSAAGMRRRPAAEIDAAAQAADTDELVHVNAGAIGGKDVEDEVRAHHARPKLAAVQRVRRSGSGWRRDTCDSKT